MRTKFMLILTITTIYAKAQNEAPELITDRPDQTESSTVVPHKSLQIEAGFVMENNETNFFKQKSFAYNITLLRYGLLENFELRLGLDYLGEQIEIKNTDSTNTISGIGPVYAGFKVQITEEDGWKPEIDFLGGIGIQNTIDDFISFGLTCRLPN